MYVAANLTDAAREQLLAFFAVNIEPRVARNWEVIAHHMTMHMGNAYISDPVGMPAKLKVIGYGVSDTVFAAWIESETPSANKIKHITIAIDRLAGAKPYDSNKIPAWTRFPAHMHIELDAIITVNS